MSTKKKNSLWGGCLVVMLAVTGIERAGAETLEIQANILAGTCDVFLAEGENQPGSDTTLSGTLDPVYTGLLKSGGVWNVKPYTLTVRGCKGGADATQAASFSVSGETVAGNDRLFRSVSSAGDPNIGIALSNGSYSSFIPWPAGGGEILEKDHPYPLSGVAVGTMPGEESMQSIQVGVSCGSSTDCPVTLTDGDITAVMTFTFAWQ
ncbi:fimbrial protein [Citrobacter koseri]|uniref:fimbrial protein n=1 Tax=Citrobacter koseri TaxID=545 RepID=UPI001F2FCF19|nr:hypothetical protein [Citrobacter koseri]